MAGCLALFTVPQLSAGQAGTGNEDGMLPYLLPMVSTGKWKYCTASVASNIATSGPGMRRVMRGVKTTISTVRKETASAYTFILLICLK